MAADERIAQEEGKLVLDFIDPLFAVAIHISLVEGIMRAQWYEVWRHTMTRFPVLNRDDGFNLWVLILGYFVVVTSWLGYHRSVAASPIRLPTWGGSLRFIIDIVLLIAYCLILARFEDFTFVLWTITATFVLFIAWDQGKRWEYLPEKEDSARRRGVTVVWCVVYALFAVLETYVWPRSMPLLLAAILGTVLYRVHKAYPRVPCEETLCFPFPKTRT